MEHEDVQKLSYAGRKREYSERIVVQKDNTEQRDFLPDIEDPATYYDRPWDES